MAIAAQPSFPKASRTRAGERVLVFEYPRPYWQERGLSWSQRANQKRSYWLRGKVLHHARHLVLCHGILVVRRNPAWTSQAYPHRGHLGEWFSPDGRIYPSRLHCAECGWSGDANVVAARNLQWNWARTFRYPTVREMRAAEARRSRKQKGDAAASREGALETVGPNVRAATDAPAGLMPWRPAPKGVDPWLLWCSVPRQYARLLPVADDSR